MPDSWVSHQQSCDAMQSEILRETRALLKKNPVCSHFEIISLLEDVHHPKQLPEFDLGVFFDGVVKRLNSIDVFGVDCLHDIDCLITDIKRQRGLLK